MSKKANRKARNGFARTKEVPHGRHPAYYKMTGQDSLKYIPITHTDGTVKLKNGETVETIQLPDNINPKERGKRDSNGKELTSNALNRVYQGKRSSLGKEIKGFDLTKGSKEKLDFIFATAAVEEVSDTSNSKKKSAKHSGHKKR